MTARARCTGLLLVLMALIVACASRTQTPPAPPPPRDDARGEADAMVSPPEAPPQSPDAAVGAGLPSRPVWREPAVDSVFAALRRDAAGEAVALVEGTDALLAVTVSGRVIAQLTDGPPSSAASYDGSRDTIWFVQDGALMGLDLRAPVLTAVRVLEQMPPLPVYLESEGGQVADDPCGVPCVLLTAAPPGFVVHPGRSDLVPGRPDEVRRIRALAKFRPVLTEAGARFLAGFAGVARRPYVEPLAVSRDVIAPDLAAQPAATRRGCNGTCGHGVALGGLGWSVVSAGRTCRCDEDLCEARCVLFNPATGRFASIDHAIGWSVRPPRAAPLCALELDRTRTAYRLHNGRVVCTSAGCRALGRRVFAWLEAGPAVPIDHLQESNSDGCGPE
jgi:hypothetical protein